MKPSRRNLVIIAAVAGLSTGFVLRRVQHPPAVDRAQDAAAAAGGKPPAARASGKQDRPALSPLAAGLEQQLAISSGVSRWLAWMDALERAKLSDFPHLARLAKGNTVVLRTIAARWIELSPVHLFDSMIAAERARPGDPSFPSDRLGQDLFEDWTARDPAAVVAALSRADLPAGLVQLRHNTLNIIVQKDPEIGLKAMCDWNIGNYGPSTEGISAWAAKDPRHAAGYALAHPAGYGTQYALEAIGKVWAKSDPDAALTFAVGLKDKFGASLASGIMTEWAAKDVAATAAWLSAASPAVRNRFSDPMLKEWARTDRSGAMQWIETNLSGSAMDEAAGAVLGGVAEKDLPGAAGLVAGMDPTMARAKAAAAVARKWIPQAFGTQKPVPPEAIAWMASLDPASIRKVVDDTQWQWSSCDPQSLADFLKTPAGVHVSAQAYSSVARNLARSDPQAALKWANQVTGDNRQLAIENVFREWQNSQPAAAAEWARKLPAGDPQREIYYLSSLRDWMGPSPEATATAKALAVGNTASALAAVEKLTNISPEAKTKLLERLQLK